MTAEIVKFGTPIVIALAGGLDRLLKPGKPHDDGSVTLTKEQMDALTHALAETNERNRQLQERMEAEKRQHQADVAANNRNWKIVFAVTVPAVALVTTVVARALTSCDGRGT